MMSECKHEFVYNYQLGEAVCLKCGYMVTKEDKKAALEYAMALMMEEDGGNDG